jgi:ribosomal protein L7/L12
MTDALSALRFPEKSGGDTFIKFETGKPVKLRVFTTNPLISLDNYGNTKYSFAVWSFDDGKAKILSKGTSIAQGIAGLHNDPDYGSNITKVDIKIIPTGDGMERRYTINVLPQAQNLTPEALKETKELDENLEKIIKNGVRAEDYNQGKEPVAVTKEDLSDLGEFSASDIPSDW